MVNHCLDCNKVLSKRSKKYCNNKCQQSYQYNQYIKRWLLGLESGNVNGAYVVVVSKKIRRYLLEKFDYKCEKCGWGETNLFTNKIPLEVHHKNNDTRNSSLDNLELLCPNCHSLTDGYRGASKNGQPHIDKAIFAKYGLIKPK
jgi:predicted restriction endonuclease